MVVNIMLASNEEDCDEYCDHLSINTEDYPFDSEDDYNCQNT